VILRFSAKIFLIAMACVGCVAKLHSERTLNPMVATQELNRCLSVVRAAAARKGSAATCPRNLAITAQRIDRRTADL
jgi:hypothetical protein